MLRGYQEVRREGGEGLKGMAELEYNERIYRQNKKRENLFLLRKNSFEISFSFGRK